MQDNIWLTMEDVCSLTNEIKETVRRKCKKGKYVSTSVMNGHNRVYSILLSSLPLKAQEKYFQLRDSNSVDLEKITQDSEDYAKAPLWARKQADKYLILMSETKNMSYTEIIKYLKNLKESNSKLAVTYQSLYYAKKNYELYGIAGILSKKGQNREHQMAMDRIYLDYFKSLYLKEGGPSASSCWRATLGYAIENGVNPETFPTYKTFERYIKQEVPEQAIYYARHGEAAWNKKYAMYVSRDYSNLKAGSCWVSDHAQIDVAVSFNNTVCFPWVTVFRDVKTSKWLGWFLHADAPNSDHIFQAFYYGAIRFGIPDDVYH